MPQTSYAYGVARVRALEPKLLGRDKIERMVEAQNGSEALKVLSETDYAVGVAELESPHEYESLLSREIQRTYELIHAISPNPEITDLFLLRYDIHNLKVLLKARFLESVEEDLLVEVGTLSADGLKTAIREKDYRWLPAFIREALERIENILSIKVDPQKIDTVLDRAMYEHIFEVVAKSRNGFAREYFSRQVDLINIRSLLRTKKIGEGFEFLKDVLIPHGRLDVSFFNRAMDESLDQLIERLAYSDYSKVIVEGIQSYIKNGNMTVFERMMDDFLMDFVKAVKSNPFGIEPIIGYLLAKENEVKLIRMIMVGKINHLPTEKIRERLRDVYV